MNESFQLRDNSLHGTETKKKSRFNISFPINFGNQSHLGKSKHNHQKLFVAGGEREERKVKSGCWEDSFSLNPQNSIATQYFCHFFPKQDKRETHTHTVLEDKTVIAKTNFYFHSSPALSLRCVGTT